MALTPINAGGTEAGPSGAPVARSPGVSWFGVRQDIPRWSSNTLFAVGFLGLLGLWWGISALGVVNPVFLPSPPKVWQTAREFIGDENLWIDIKVSVWRVTAGFLL